MLWISLKYRIRDFAIKHGRQLKLDRAKKAKSSEDRLSKAVEREDSLVVDLPRRDLERKASGRYKVFLVRTKLKRVSNEAVKYNAFMREEEVRRFPHWYIKFVKSLDGHALRSNREMCGSFWALFRDRFTRCSDLPV